MFRGKRDVPHFYIVFAPDAVARRENDIEMRDWFFQDFYFLVFEGFF